MKASKLLFIFLILLLLSGIVINILPHFYRGGIKNDFPVIRNSIRIIAVLILLQFGTLLKSKHCKFILFCVFLSLIGVVFKILHWPFADILLAAPAVTSLFLYINHYVKKPVKDALDIAKLFYVTFICLRIAASAFPSINTDCAKHAEDILFHILFLIFTIQFYKRKLSAAE